MLRTTVAAAVIGLAGAFRIDKAAGPQKSVCIVSGDPHFRGFDSSLKAGGTYDPMHALGHFWLVKTESGKIQVQGTYGDCGQRNGPSWMASRKDGKPRTCLTGIAVSGSFMGGRTLSVKPGCDWDWGNGNCRNSDTNMPRITWKGERVNSVSSDAGVAVTSSSTRVTVTLPEDMKIDITMVGQWGTGRSYTYMDAQIWMVQGSGGKQCGHCGDFDGNPNNDQIFEEMGGLRTPAKGSLCDSVVDYCHERLMHGGECATTTTTTVPQATTTTTTPCSKEGRDKASVICNKRFQDAIDPALAAKIPMVISEDELRECIMDVCEGGEGFAADDAKAAADEDIALIKMK